MLIRKFMHRTIPSIDEALGEILDEVIRMAPFDIDPTDFLELMRWNVSILFEEQREKHSVEIARLKGRVKGLEEAVKRVETRIEHGNWFINIFRRIRRYLINRSIRKTMEIIAEEEGSLEFITKDKIEKRVNQLQSRLRYEMAVSQPIKSLISKNITSKHNGKKVSH